MTANTTSHLSVENTSSSKSCQNWSTDVEVRARQSWRILETDAQSFEVDTQDAQYTCTNEAVNHGVW